MKFKLVIDLHKQEITTEYRRVILSLIKKALTSANNGKYFNEVFNGANSKEYTFSVKLPGAKFNKNNVLLGKKNIEVVFSTFDRKLGYILYATFSEQINKKFPLANDNYLIIKSMQLLKEKEINGDEMLIKFMSPLVIRQHTKEGNKDWYYSYDDIDFEEKCIFTIKNQLLRSGFSKEQIKDLNVHTIDMKKIIVTHYGCKIPCNLGFIIVQGKKSILNYLLKSGIGSRRSAGFGMAELIVEQEV